MLGNSVTFNICIAYSCQEILLCQLGGGGEVRVTAPGVGGAGDITVCNILYVTPGTLHSNALILGQL